MKSIPSLSWAWPSSAPACYFLSVSWMYNHLHVRETLWWSLLLGNQHTVSFVVTCKHRGEFWRNTQRHNMANQLLLVVQGIQWCNMSYSLFLTFHFSEADPPSEEESKYFHGLDSHKIASKGGWSWSEIHYYCEWPLTSKNQIYPNKYKRRGFRG